MNRRHFENIVNDDRKFAFKNKKSREKEIEIIMFKLKE